MPEKMRNKIIVGLFLFVIYVGVTWSWIILSTWFLGVEL
jgi:hypothetical protein